MRVGNAGGIDRKPRWEQFADRSTSEQAQTSGGHSIDFLLTPNSASVSPLARTPFWRGQRSRRNKRKKFLRAKNCPGLTLFMALRLEDQSLTFYDFSLLHIFNFFLFRHFSEILSKGVATNERESIAQLFPFDVGQRQTWWRRNKRETKKEGFVQFIFEFFFYFRDVPVRGNGTCCRTDLFLRWSTGSLDFLTSKLFFVTKT